MPAKGISIHDLYEDSLGLYVVIDDHPNETEQVILMPVSWTHRILRDRTEILTPSP